MKLIFALTACFGLSACVSTQEMSLAPNVVRIDTAARGAIFVGSASNVTLKKAAEATLARGYTHFLLFDPQMSQGSQVVGMTGSGYGTATTIGGTTYVKTSGFGTPIRAPTANVGVTVVMYRTGDPEAQNAFDAVQIVKQFGG
jgi:heptaprenylglyceryl phosphate synthase